jgi:raffinose/stachyose/melibiose transport system permease protein
MLPASVIYAVLVIVPIGRSFYYSFFDWNTISKKKFAGFRNFIELFSDEKMRVSLVNSFILMAALIFICLVIALIFALIFARKIPGEKIFKIIFFIPVLMSSVTVAQLWAKIYSPETGLLNVLLRQLGFESLAHSWMQDKEVVLAAALVPVIWKAIGWYMLLLYTGAKGVSKEMYEASRIDGASEFTVATRITIPLISPTIMVCLTLAMMYALKEFDIIYNLTGGGPIYRTSVPLIYMYEKILSYYGFGSSISVVIIIMCLIISIAVRKLFPKVDTTL